MCPIYASSRYDYNLFIANKGNEGGKLQMVDYFGNVLLREEI